MASNTTTAAATKALKIGIIIGSQRVVRIGPQVTNFVLETIKAAPAADGQPDIAFDVIDVAALGLPFFDEPTMPAFIKNPDDYTHEHTRAWSRRVAALDGFIFVSPQYNGSVPAGLKNAVDFLFNEWGGKPAAVVTYGGNGGDKADDAWRSILAAVMSMTVVSTRVNLKFPNQEFTSKACAGKHLDLDARSDASDWADKREDIKAMWRELSGLLATKST